MKLALGTVQFGQTYGVANHGGQVGHAEIARILGLAREALVDTIDTAIAYGDSEASLGAAGVGDFRIVTKLPRIASHVEDVATWVMEQLQASLSRLGVPALHGALCHHAPDWFGEHGDALRDAFDRAKASGLVEKVGVSIYDPGMLDSIVEQARPDLVQAPLSILDRRLISSGWLDRLHDDGIELHARSIFLQGVLLMARDERPGYFNRWAGLWADWHHFLTHHDLTALEACLGYALSHPQISRVVVGVDSAGHFEELCRVARRCREVPGGLAAMADLELLDPSRWRLD